MAARLALRNSVAKLLFVSGVTAPGRRGRGRLSVVTFHRVLPADARRAYPYPGLAVTPEELDAFLAYFQRYFDCGPLRTQHRRYLTGEASPRPLLAVTFDDGQHDNYQYARPVLARHGIQASFFIPVSAVERQELLWHDRVGFAVLALLGQGDEGRKRISAVLAAAGIPPADAGTGAEGLTASAKRLGSGERQRLVSALEDAAGPGREIPAFARMMTIPEVVELAAEGHEIGSHSMTHCLMPECETRDLQHELSESKRVLESRLGEPVESFCYPNGDADLRVAAATAASGYHRAVTTQWGDNGREANPFLLRRFDMDARQAQDSAGQIRADVVAFRMSGMHPSLR